MRRAALIPFILLLTVLCGGKTNAAIVWLNDFQQFSFAVESNEGLFQYAPLTYLSYSSDTPAV